MSDKANTITLVDGTIALIDEADLPLVEGYRWRLTKGGYAFTGPGAKGHYRMHRLIMGLKNGDKRQVEHINGNRLDNRRANLRVVEAHQAVLERFWSRVVKADSGCWEWTGGCAGRSQEYGVLQVHGVRTRAHRFAYELFVGPIPEGLQIDHLCRNPRCVNPAHMEPVTSRENTLRGESPFAQHARQTHCKHGHPLFGPNVSISRSTGARQCKACHREKNRRQRARERELRDAARGNGEAG